MTEDVTPTRGGELVVVGTPIGNLGDLSPRAVETLARADVVVCEDSRRTGALLRAAAVGPRPLLVANDHTESAVRDEVVARVLAGATVALVSDAGMPVISDPGTQIVAAVAAAGVPVVVVPGPTAVSAALALSGLPAGRFVFEGFLPRKGPARAERIAALATETRTVVLYEAPHRIERTLADLADRFGDDRPAALGRELTKLHEETVRGTLGSLRATDAVTTPRGEFVVVVAGAPEAAPATDDDVRRALDAARDRGASTRDAVAAVADALDVPKRRVYDLATS